MSTPVSPWVGYQKWNRRDERMALLWVRDIVAFLRELPCVRPGAVALDFGCGYFDAGLAIADRVARVDGTDIDPPTVGVARERVRAAGLASRIEHGLEGLSAGTYDLIFANSVFQYLDGDAGIAATLTRFRELLQPGGTVVVADLIPRAYSKGFDACRSLWVATWNGVLPAMLAHLWKAARNPTGTTLHQIDPDRFAELATAAGFACERLTRNLTPSRQRYSCVLSAR